MKQLVLSVLYDACFAPALCGAWLSSALQMAPVGVERGHGPRTWPASLGLPIVPDGTLTGQEASDSERRTRSRLAGQPSGAASAAASRLRDPARRGSNGGGGGVRVNSESYGLNPTTEAG